MRSCLLAVILTTYNNLSLVAYIALVWDMDAKDEYFKLDECNAVDYHDR